MFSFSRESLFSAESRSFALSLLHSSRRDQSSSQFSSVPHINKWMNARERESREDHRKQSEAFPPFLTYRAYSNPLDKRLRRWGWESSSESERVASHRAEERGREEPGKRMSGEYIIFHIAPPVEGKKGTKQGWRVRELFSFNFFRSVAVCFLFLLCFFLVWTTHNEKKEKKRREKRKKSFFDINKLLLRRNKRSAADFEGLILKR